MSHHYAFPRTAVVITLAILIFCIPSLHAQPVGGLGKITDSAFAPIPDSGFLGGPNVSALITFDADGDGKPDAAVINAGSFRSVTFLRNMSTPGAPDLEDAYSLSSAQYAGPMTFGDLDGDGKPDFVITSLSGTLIYLFRNISTPGHIAFDTAVVIKPSGYPGTLLIRDIDHDGKADLLVAETAASGSHGNGNIAVYRNTSTPGTFSFQPEVNLATREYPQAVTPYDLTGDGLPDLVYTPQRGNSICYLVNTSTSGTISFAAEDSTLTSNRPDGMAAGDLDGDGKPDLAVYNFHENSLSLYRNTGTGALLHFQETVLPLLPDTVLSGYPFVGPITVSIADLNLDGKPDLLFECYNSPYAGVLENTTTTPGFFVFDRPHYIRVIPGPTNGTPFIDAYTIAIGDLDGDSLPDLLSSYNVTSNYYQSLTPRLNQIDKPRVMPSGASPVSGAIAGFVNIDSVIRIYNGSPYLQRHFDIEPAVNAATSTATITLYYNQQDFDNYNALAAHGDDLPKGPSDSADKVHIRLLQYHGLSTTRIPGSYSGSSQVIDPDDSRIVWNDSSARWEISFEITGFSGFFLGSSGTTLPLTLLSFTGGRQGTEALLRWTTSNEINVRGYEVQRSVNAIRFVPLGLVSASDSRLYTYPDSSAGNRSWYYRLKMIDMDGKYTYSDIIGIAGLPDPSGLNIFPNPAQGSATLQHPQVMDGTAQIELTDMSGRVVRTIRPAPGASQTSLSLDGLAPGLYVITLTDSTHHLTGSLLVK